MNRISSFALSFIAAATVGLSGCGGNGGATGSPTTQIYTQATISGVTQAWTGASLYGESSPPFACSLTTDPNGCQTTFGPVSTDSTGHYTLQTDDLPATWSIGAKADSTCSAGASSGIIQVSVGVPVTLTCGQDYATDIVASPQYCTITVDQINGTSSDCPASITLTAQNSIFSTGYATTASSYDASGTLLRSDSITASSATTITVPTPSSAGFHALTFVNPTTNQIFGAAEFTVKKVIVKCTPKTC
jgi:hypothetical protein